MIDLEGIADALTNGAAVTLPARGLPQLLADVENALIDRALADARGVKAQAALALGINRTTLVEKLRRRNARARR